MAPEIIIPRTLGAPRFVCRLCREPFWAERQWIDHLKACYSEHEAEIQASRPANVMPDMYGPNAGDPELAEYWRKNPPKD